LRCWARRTGNATVAMHPLAHPEVHERHAYAVLSRLDSVWPTRERRHPTAAEVREHPEPFGTLLLELPLRDAGYLLPSWDELTATVAAARERGAKVHFDGARIWETTTHFGHGLGAIAGLADSVYVSFYKTLGGISGAALGRRAGRRGRAAGRGGTDLAVRRLGGRRAGVRAGRGHGCRPGAGVDPRRRRRGRQGPAQPLGADTMIRSRSGAGPAGLPI